MKELVGVFGNEVFRPLVTLVIPGAIAIAPNLLFLREQYPALRAIPIRGTAETITAFTVLSIFFGLIIDDLGTHIEDGWDNRQLDVHQSNWYRYLRFAFKTEPVGHRYLRNLVLRLKFELASYVAILVSLPGCLWLLVAYLDPYQWLPLITFSVLLAIWLRHEAHCTHGALQRVRHHLLDGIVESPDSVPGPCSEFPHGRKELRNSRISWAALIFGVLACVSLAITLGLSPNFLWRFAVHCPVSRAYTQPQSNFWFLFLSLCTLGFGFWASRQRGRRTKVAKLTTFFGGLLVLGALALPWVRRLLP